MLKTISANVEKRGLFYPTAIYFKQYFCVIPTFRLFFFPLYRFSHSSVTRINLICPVNSGETHRFNIDIRYRVVETRCDFDGSTSAKYTGRSQSRKHFYDQVASGAEEKFLSEILRPPKREFICNLFSLVAEGFSP